MYARLRVQLLRSTLRSLQLSSVDTLYSRYGHFDAVRYLMTESYFDLHIKDLTGLTLLHYACKLVTCIICIMLVNTCFYDDANLD